MLARRHAQQRSRRPHELVIILYAVPMNLPYGFLFSRSFVYLPYCFERLGMCFRFCIYFAKYLLYNTGARSEMIVVQGE